MKSILYALGFWVSAILAGLFLLGAIVDESHLLYAIIMAPFAAAALWCFRKSRAATQEKQQPRQSAVRPIPEPEPLTAPTPDPKITEAQREAWAAERRQKEAAFTAILDAIPEVQPEESEAPAKHQKLADMPEYAFSNITKKTPRDKLSNFVVIDVETTGLYPARNEIVEVAAIRFRGFEPVAKLSTLCTPRKGIDEDAAKINGITEDMVDGRPPFDLIAGAVQAFIGEDNVVGHNLEFDLRFLWRYGVDFFCAPRKFYDTLDIAGRTLKRQKYKYDKEYGGRLPDYESPSDVSDYKLGTLCSYYGIAYSEGHRALADAYATGKLLESLAKDRE